jgi:hypothetical protein
MPKHILCSAEPLSIVSLPMGGELFVTGSRIQSVEIF